MRNSVLGIVCLGVLGAPLAAASECYGPVGNSETLWPIALRLRPDPSISPQRMMLALLEANPEAFSRANVNALNAGSTLCFGPGELIGLDEEAAIAVVGRHNREWRSGSEELGAGSNESMPAASRAGRRRRGRACRSARPRCCCRVRFASRAVGAPDWRSGSGAGPVSGSDRAGAGTARDARGPYRGSGQHAVRVDRGAGHGGRAAGNGADADAGAAGR